MCHFFLTPPLLRRTLRWGWRLRWLYEEERIPARTNDLQIQFSCAFCLVTCLSGLRPALEWNTGSSPWNFLRCCCWSHWNQPYLTANCCPHSELGSPWWQLTLRTETHHCSKDLQNGTWLCPNYAHIRVLGAFFNLCGYSLIVNM